jgi:hypothetical protein
MLEELFEEGDLVAETVILKADRVECTLVSLTAGFPVLFLVDVRGCNQHAFQGIIAVVNRLLNDLFLVISVLFPSRGPLNQ